MLRWPWKRGKEEDPHDAAERLIAQGNRLEDAGDPARACVLYRQALALAPNLAKAHLNLGVALEACGDGDSAKACYERSLAIEPRNAAASFNLGKLLYTRGALDEARGLLGRALQIRPDFADARMVHGYVLYALGQPEAAAAELAAALQQRPDDAGARAALAGARSAIALQAALGHHQAGRRSEARMRYQEALSLDADNIDALHLLGVLAHEEGDYDQAARMISRSLDIRPANAHAHFNLGRVRQAQGRADEALCCYGRALAHDPAHHDALTALASLHCARGEWRQAADAYRRILEHHPQSPEALCDLGTALKGLGRLAEALDCYRRARALDPKCFNAHYNLAIAERDEGRLEAAVTDFRHALAVAPDRPEVHYALGHVLHELERQPEAVACFRRAVELDPSHAQARWSIAMAQLHAVYAAADDVSVCRTRFSEELAVLEAWVENERSDGRYVAVGSDQPFALAYQEENNRDLLARYGALCARLMAEWADREALPAPRRGTGRPLRVGIVSAHFRRHSVWSAIARGWFAELDPRRFALYAFDLGTTQDEETAFAKARAAYFAAAPRSLRQWVRDIGACEPDVLVYPEVGMDSMTIRLASLRLAPVQIASWGHPETTGLPTMDYFLSAADLEPDDAQAHYTERLIMLPHLGCHFSAPSVSPEQPDIARAGLDPEQPLLVCPGVPFKYDPRHDRVLCEIAHRLGRCQFVFFSHWNRALSDRLAVRLQRAFSASGLDPRRFVHFLPWQPAPAFHGWLGRADVFLDTIGFSGFNTALHAVECGLPIVTREGRFMRGRLASGILKRLALDELVASEETTYVDLVVKLVMDTAYRQSVAKRMRSGRAALYEDSTSVRALEEFLQAAHGSAK